MSLYGLHLPHFFRKDGKEVEPTLFSIHIFFLGPFCYLGALQEREIVKQRNGLAAERRHGSFAHDG
jgi:hypothetical protein